PQGTLDLLILTILSREALHGYGISQRLLGRTRGEFLVKPGAPFPSLYKLEQDGKLASEWRASENNRRAKYYRLTRTGKKQLAREQERWNRALVAISHVLEGA